MIYHTWYIVYDVSYMIYKLWYIICDISYTIYQIDDLRYEGSYMIYQIWTMMLHLAFMICIFPKVPHPWGRGARNIWVDVVSRSRTLAWCCKQEDLWISMLPCLSYIHTIGNIDFGIKNLGCDVYLEWKLRLMQ